MGNQDIIRTENVLVRVMELEKDASTGWHYHSMVSDYFVCLNGVVRVESKSPDEVIVLYPGRHLEIKPPQVHRVINAHTEKSEYLLVQGVGVYDYIKV